MPMVINLRLIIDRETEMPRPKRKPNYNGTKTMQELLNEICDYFGAPVDDREREVIDHVRLRSVADHFGITLIKARKLLITGGRYSTYLSREVQEMYANGKTIQEIMHLTKLKKSSVYSYLPYDRLAYKLPDSSIEAERQKQYRVRKRNAARTDAEKEEKLWTEMTALQGCLFSTCKGLDFTYRFRGGEMFVDRREKSITKASVMTAYRKVKELGGEVTGPKQLGVFGASYVWPVFLKMGIIKKMK